MSYTVEAKGLEIVGDLDDLKKTIPRRAAQALNKIATQTRTKSARQIRTQLAFPASYLAPAQGRLTVGKKASAANLTASVRGRSRPTSLARFKTGTATRGKGVKVRVKPGRIKHLKRAFLVNLRSGNADAGLGNVGLAVRSDTKPGRAYRPKKIGQNLWLLYAPSVAQALLNARKTGIWLDLEPEIGADLEREFLRLLELDI